MEIGRAGKLSTYEKELYTKKIIGLSITAFLMLVFISFFIIVNYTSLLERKVFEYIADTQGYELSYSNTYELLSSKNADQGNYIQLSDKDNNIYILFRYDETSTELIEIVDNISNTSKMYAVTPIVNENNKIKTEKDIINNIDKEFSPLGSASVISGRKNTGGGYSIIAIDNIMNQHRINYKSNLLTDKETVQEYSNRLSNNGVLAVSQWFNHRNTINYQLAILKALVETSNDGDTSGQILYSGGDRVNEVINEISIIKVGDSTIAVDKQPDEEDIDKKSIDDSLNGFIGSKEEILETYSNIQFSTYTSLIINSEKSASDLDSKSIDSNHESSGVIIGACENTNKAIDKMSSTLELLIIISYLEKTLLL